MNGSLKELLTEMMHPPLQPRKSRFIGFLIGLPLGFIAMYCMGLPLWINIMITAALAICIPLAFVWEIRSEKKNADFKEAVESGDYYETEEWREKYRKYRETHDFSRVKAQTMQADLKKRYLKPSGIVLAAVSLAFFIPALIWESGDPAINIILAVSGLGFLLWGIWKLYRTPVRAFLREYEAELPHIARSYLNGKVLSFRSSGLSAENNGINIGGNYTVMWYKKGIVAIDNKRITKVTKQVQRTNYYGDGLYLGAGTAHRLCIGYKDAAGKSWNCRIQLNEYQTEMACEALAPFRTAAEYSENIHHEIG
ncbi:MAG: hypothetical protein IKQ91_07820 [Oscillospiraceae bacterium]|nr:hypothetical protein [Oscillospiraceae bacterium]